MRRNTLLHSLSGLPQIRERLHTICALYAHTPPQRRTALMEHLEQMTLETAALLATEMLEAGWRPTEPEPQTAPTRPQSKRIGRQG